MISIGENKASLCKGDFHPAELYKGNKKIAGYTAMEFSSEGGVTLENCYNDRLHNAKIIGNSVQDGTPTPENPVEVQSVGELQTDGEHTGKYKIPVRVKGKNLWGRGNFIKSDASTTSCRQTFKASDHPWIKGGTTLTITLTVFVSEMDTRQNPCFSFGVQFSDNTSFVPSKHYWQKGIAEKYSYTITLPTGISGVEKEILQLNIRPIDFSSNSDKVWDAYVKDIQIELGDTATDYEPYTEPQAYDIYLDEPLRKIGDYADYIDFENLKVVRNVGNKIFTGEESIASIGLSSTSNLYRYAMGISEMPNLYAERILMSNYFATGNYLDLRDNTSQAVGIMSTSRITFSSTIATLSEFENWIKDLYSSNPLYVYYPLKESTEEAVELPELPTLKGTTIYETDTSVTAVLSGKYIIQGGIK